MGKSLKESIRLQLKIAALILLLTVGFSVALLYNLLDNIGAETTAGVQSVTAMADTSRHAQIAFQRQVQEWKNILLRGRDPQLFRLYANGFQDQYVLVQRELRDLADGMKRLGIDNAHVNRMLDTHADMMRQYLEALEKSPLTARPDNFRRVDEQMRGIDRALSAEFDTLGKEVEVAALKQIASVSGVVQGQHAWQKYYLLSVLLLVLPGVGLFSFRRIGKLSRQLAEEKERAQVTLSSIGDAVIVTDVKGHVEYMNAVAEEMTGWPLPEARGRALQEVFVIVNESTRQTVENPVEVVFRVGHVVGLANHTALIARDGSERSIADSAAPVRNEDGVISGAVLVFHDSTEQMDAQRKIQHLAYHDHLTSLPNRRLLQDRVGVAMTAAARHQSRLALLFLDLDHFKVINDTLGHEYGDLLLKAAARRLADCVREHDTVARTGGDEFVILLDDIRDSDDAVVVAKKILEKLSLPYQIKHADLHSTPSIGISMYPDDGEDFETLMKHADTAMYYAKERGRAGYRFFTENMNARTLERLTVENNLHKALARNEFALYYQPKVDMRDGKVIGAEALIRWQHPELGLIPPDKFIPIAEESNIISSIGEWVARTACVQSRAWQDMGLRLPVSINVSARQFLHGDLPIELARILGETGADPALLELELTEGVLLHSQDAEVKLAALKHMGFKVALDDFGTGYSSLAYLRRMAIDTLKIDRSFVMNLENNPDDVAIVQTIISMAHSLRMNVIAEGVETVAQAQLLVESGCRECQGYYFGKPQPVDEFSALISKQQAQPA